MTDLPVERRSRPRAGLLGKATIVWARSTVPAEFNIRDLSTGGARLIGRAQLVESERIQVMLELDEVTVSVAAEVLRTEPQNAQVAIGFRDLSREATEVIERAVTALIECVRAGSPPTVLILRAPAEARAAIERDLAQLGRAVRACTTMLETVWALENPTVRYEAVVIASDMDSEPLGELLKHLSEQHPQFRRLLLFGDQLESVDRVAASHVDAVLRTPLRIRALARALGIRETDSSLAMLLPE